MTGRFFVVGVGPGNPELMTLKAVRLLNRCPVWIAPKGKENGESMALSIIDKVVSRQNKEILEVHFPMKKIRSGNEDRDVLLAWQKAALDILARLSKGSDVAFPTMGDPSIYSTASYVCETLMDISPDTDITIVPGVSSISASAASSRAPLCLGGEQFVVIPATFDDSRLRAALLTFDTVILMKVHSVMDRLTSLLGELNLLDKAILIERSSLGDERIVHNIMDAANTKLHYFSTIIVRKSSRTRG